MRLIAATTAIVLAGVGGGANWQQPVFRAGAEVVQVDVLVSDRGVPVPGLGREHFEIRDNGVAQSVDFVSFDDRPVNVILTLDRSSSVAGTQMTLMRAAGHAVLDALRPDDRAAFLGFSHRVSGEPRLTGDFAAIRAAIDAVGSQGGTSLLNAAFAALALGHAEQGRSLAIVFSDGVDSTSWLDAESVIAVAARSQVVVYGVTVGKVSSSFLDDLAAKTGGRVVDARSFADLRQTFLTVLGEFRHRYLLGYTPRGVAADGWHRLDVRLRGARGSVKARPGYQRKGGV